MAKTTARERRAAAREERRGSTHDELTVDDAMEADPADALRAAASAAIAGAAVGAARAFALRRHADGDGEEEESGEKESDDEQSPEPAAGAEQIDDRDADAPEEQEPPREPLPAGDARRIVQRAREQLRDLHGAEAESVSAIRRTAEGWRVGLEVVEVHRVPESTDVLATYEVEVDGDGQLLALERTTRYYRSEADRR